MALKQVRRDSTIFTYWYSYEYIVFIMTQITEFTMSSEYNDYVALVDVLDYDQQVNIPT